MSIYFCWLYQRGENFQFDQEQRLSRELLRQILQLKRFTLFREELGCIGLYLGCGILEKDLEKLGIALHRDVEVSHLEISDLWADVCNFDAVCPFASSTDILGILNRQDIRDLVELTVGKMEMYHLVAALFMESSMALCLGVQASHPGGSGGFKLHTHLITEAREIDCIEYLEIM
jgi:hypothetical protein